MHLGNARTALLAWLAARSAGGSVVLRIEDLDHARVVPGAEARLLDELRFLGLDWDEGPDLGGPHAPYRQSERRARYDAAIDRLLAAGQAYLCACSRADIARAASAPHGEDGGPRYPGTCADLRSRRGAGPGGGRRAAALGAVPGRGRPPAVRRSGARARRSAGPGRHRRLRHPPRRRDRRLPPGGGGGRRRHGRSPRWSGATTCCPRPRGSWRCTGRWAGAAPSFAHVPLVLAPGGERLAKRTRPISIGDLRQQGLPPQRIVGALAASAGLASGQHVTPAELLTGFSLQRIGRQAGDGSANLRRHPPAARDSCETSEAD